MVFRKLVVVRGPTLLICVCVVSSVCACVWYEQGVRWRCANHEPDVGVSGCLCVALTLVLGLVLGAEPKRMCVCCVAWLHGWLCWCVCVCVVCDVCGMITGG